jgi:hypothetical protein
MRYRPVESDLVVDVPGGLVIPLQVTCPGAVRDCGPPERHRSPLAGLISLFAPLLVALK